MSTAPVGKKKKKTLFPLNSNPAPDIAPEADAYVASMSSPASTTEATSPRDRPASPKQPGVPDGAWVITEDPYLEPFRGALMYRYSKYLEAKKAIQDNEGGLEKFSRGYDMFGFTRGDKGFNYREWAPGAQKLSLIGDFNGWDRNANPCERNEFGVWSTFLPDNDDGTPLIPHRCKVKAALTLADGAEVDRIPAWISRAEQHASDAFHGVFWNPPEEYTWRNAPPAKPKSLKIYEAHVGIASPEPKVASYKNFTHNVLPRIVKGGYNAIQLMAVMEHAFYGSFGYQVNCFFAASSRCGPPEDLKELIDTAHGHGITVILDVVHSHASKNVLDGLNMFDGTDHQYFHGGEAGTHPLWDSRLFNYSHWEVKRFLLSNLRWWVEEYHFDGFRFDGATSMLYKHHGLSHGFSGDYSEYFGDSVDMDAVVYFMLANDLLHELYPHIITIAEDVSGMPTLCRPVPHGGIGFDYRLAMAIPDMWIKLLRESKDDDWSIGHVVHTLTNRRYNEKTIGYCESHDQALVGDKTLAFWMMDKEMYTNMSALQPATPVIDRGIALHKMIRLVTMILGGEGYMTFIGNEFGHPEWLDFPREGNNWSYQYARRQFNLVDDDTLRYKHLNAFDIAMVHLENKYPWLSAPSAYISRKEEGDKFLAGDIEALGLVFVFNFHPEKSFEAYRVGVPTAGIYQVVLSSDDGAFGGYDRVAHNVDMPSVTSEWDGRPHYVEVYAPSRTCFVLARVP